MIGLAATAWLLSALALSTAVIMVIAPFASRVGLVDIPNGRKQHHRKVPVVGGVGIFAALVIVLQFQLWLEPADRALLEALLVGSMLLFAVGLLDDIRPMGVYVRLAVQGGAGLIAALWGGLILEDFGFLLTANLHELGFFAVPVTLIAIVAMINATNMIDGIDGLSGSLSLVSVTLLAVVALNGQQAGYLPILLAMFGALIGFLVFNLRCCGRRRASVFMGDAGSTVLGFLFACVAIGLSQGEGRSMAPVTALWLFAVPLTDALATTSRRLWLGRSPFYPDRTHLHHLLLDAGITVPQSVAVLALLQLFLGAVGLFGLYAGVPEYAMFAAFLFWVGAYLYGVSRPWRFVSAAQKTHRQLDLPVAGVNAVYIGGLPHQGADALLRKILGEDFEDYGYELYARSQDQGDQESYYAIVCVGCELTTARIIRRLKGRARLVEGIVIRQFIPRKRRNSQSSTAQVDSIERPTMDRRRGGRLVAVAPLAPWTDQPAGYVSLSKGREEEATEEEPKNAAA